MSRLTQTSDPVVAVLIRHHHPRYSGAGALMDRLAWYLEDHGIPTIMISAWQGWRWGVDVVETQGRSIRVMRVPAPGEGRINTLSFYSLALLRTLLLPASIRLVIGVGESRHLGWIAWACRLTGRRFIQQTQMDGFRSCVRRFPPNSQYWMQQADAAVALCEPIRQRMIEAGFPAARIRVIPNANDHHKYRPPRGAERASSRTVLNLTDDTPTVLFIGMVSQRKGVPLLLKAWPLVLCQLPRARLLLVGPCGLELGDPFGLKDAQRMTKTLDITSSTTFVRRVVDLMPFYWAADVFVLPSRQEGHPGVLVEAMLCGLPCVITRFMGYHEDMGRDGRHLAVSEATPEALAAKLVYYLQHRDEAALLGREARGYAAARFSMETVGAAYLQLVREVLGEAK